MAQATEREGVVAGRPPRSRALLLVAFAFAVMGDPVSSVAYAIEAALRKLGGDLGLLFATMAVVVGIIALVVVNYHQLIARFPRGGGAAAAAGAAFGEGWSFLPLGSLIVDYALTISVSVAAGSSAIIAYLPRLDPYRVPLALGLTVVVAALTWFGHGGRAIFAAMTILFVLVAAAVIVRGFLDPVAHGAVALVPRGEPRHAVPIAVLLAFPVGMALATGVEAPSSAIAQLGQLGERSRAAFGRITIWTMLVIVGILTLGLTDLAVRLRIGLPPADSTLVAETARAAVGSGPLFAAFQLSSALLLLAAASSSFQAGPGLLKALAADRTPTPTPGILPGWLGAANRHHTPYWGVVVFLAVSAALVILAGGRDQELVLFYAVAVFISFFIGLVAMAAFSLREGHRLFLWVNVLGALAVAVTLVVNLAEVYPIASLVASAGIAAALYAVWVRKGRPTGVSAADLVAEASVANRLPSSDAASPLSAADADQNE